MPIRGLIVAIDGPSGAGKGTVARTVAARLGYRHIDTGAMYRAVAWKAQREGLDLEDGPAMAAVAARAEFTLNERTVIDGHDVTTAIRTPAIDEAAAVVARHPEVRAVLVDRQRRYAGQSGIVMEGRDIGTVVFPDAEVKLFLDASADERARRRAGDTDHASSREQPGVDSIAQALEARDRSDRTRTVSPLTRAADATYIDTTGVPIESVVARVLAIVEERISGARVS